jgi:hypothetical protein
METNLHVVLTLVDGEQVTQDILCPPDKAEQVMNQLMVQYSQVGLLKKDGDKYLLYPAHRITLVECELPSLVIATPSDTARAAQAAGGLKKITLS